jgi:hypothetical protein
MNNPVTGNGSAVAQAPVEAPIVNVVNHTPGQSQNRLIGAVTRYGSQREASDAHHKYTPPLIDTGCPVIFRSPNTGVESLAMITRRAGRLFDLTVLSENQRVTTKLGVSYFDESDKDNSDPWAGWNSNGSFRMTEWTRNINFACRALQNAAIQEAQAQAIQEGVS